MRKLVLILIGFIAVITFIRAFDNTPGIPSNGIQPAAFQADVLVIAD